MKTSDANYGDKKRGESIPSLQPTGYSGLRPLTPLAELERSAAAATTSEFPMLHFKPSTYSTVSPYLIVTDAAATITFLQTVFSGEVLRSFPDEQGRLMHAEVRIDDTVLMLADSAPEWPPVPAYVHIYVKDVDDTYSRAIAAGAISVQAPEKKQDEDKRGGVKDVGGTTWWIATRVE